MTIRRLPSSVHKSFSHIKTRAPGTRSKSPPTPRYPSHKHKPADYYQRPPQHLGPNYSPNVASREPSSDRFWSDSFLYAHPPGAPAGSLPRSVPIDSSVYGLTEQQVFAIQPNFSTEHFSSSTIFAFSNRPSNIKLAWEKKAEEIIRQQNSEPQPISLPQIKPRQDTNRRELMTSHVDIVSTPTADTPGSCLYVHFDKRRYLFGRLSEGTQRALGQRKYAMSTLEQFFVTGDMSWKTLGGMMGIIMTVSDVINTSRDAMQLENEARIARGRAPLAIDLIERLHMHGSDNLSYIMATARSFIFRTGIPFKTFELYEDARAETPDLDKPDWEDDCLRIWKVPIYPKTNKRWHDGEPTSPGPTAETAEAKAQRRRDKDTLSAVVENMFNSSWRIDKLVPTMLHNVQMPAKIFIKGDDGVIRLYTGPRPRMDGDNSGVPNIEVLVREPWPATKVSVLPAPLLSGQALCYIAKNHQRRGKFNPKAAKDLNVPTKMFRELTAGRSIEVDGKTVTPDMVMEPPIPGKGFVVADIPDCSYLESFFARPEWKNTAIMSDVNIFYWMLPAGLAQDASVLRFMRQHSHIKHIVLAPDVSPNMLAFESHGTILTTLHRLDPDRYPILKFDNAAPEITIPGGVPFEIGRVGKRMMTMPKFEEKPANILPFPNLLERLNTIDPEILQLADEARQRVSTPEFQARVDAEEADIPNRDAQVITLGTGSAVPSKYRNVSSTLIRVPGVGNYMLDCGENTLGQIRRMYGADEARAIIASLRFLFISHLHADHHLGTITVIEEWIAATQNTEPQPKLTVGCTRFMKVFLDEYANARALDLSNIIFSGLDAGDADFLDTFPAEHPSGLVSAHYVRVNHCKGAHAGVFTWASGLKISYSGDCRPSPHFARMGRDSTLLIHECTFESDKQADAVNKKHSTMAEALDVASKMRARRVMLTHFSQRYAKLPAQHQADADAQDEQQLDEEERKTRAVDKQRVVLMGCDQMVVKIGEFQHAAEYLPAVLRFLQDEEKE
ncbi:hypothetical protein TD95_000769 [Thielaviopsis punctulata]|uniref:ribonuclease Z n=1 Tax=Thielaviopsis punctulata TaxID=72032 RepID=A0A0F4ZAH4_9PEZI|nr:hypothetical protein TD95_000769 [Thielaviopsis punctulata]